MSALEMKPDFPAAVPRCCAASGSGPGAGGTGGPGDRPRCMRPQRLRHQTKAPDESLALCSVLSGEVKSDLSALLRHPAALSLPGKSGFHIRGPEQGLGSHLCLNSFFFFQKKEEGETTIYLPSPQPSPNCCVHMHRAIA